MNKQNLKFISIFLLALFLFNTWQLYQMKQDYTKLSSYYNSTLQQIQADMSHVQNIVQEQYEHIDHLLAEQNALFSFTDISIKLDGKQLAVTISATPKELKKEETLLARITTDEKTYEQTIGSTGSTTLRIEPTTSIQPVLIIQSSSGIRQEVLETVPVANYITGYIEASWDSDSNEMPLDIYLDAKSQPFALDEIIKAKCILVNTGENSRKQNAKEDAETAIAIPVSTQIPTFSDQIPKGDEITAIKQMDSTINVAHYQIHLPMEYKELEDGIRYDIYFQLTTADGITFATSEGKIADFCYADKYSETANGSATLFPILN